MKDYLTTAEAAIKLGISHGRVKQLVAAGRLIAEKVGSVNLIPVAVVRAYRPGKTGYPKGRKRSTT